MSTLPSKIAGLLVAALVSAPALALACPNCAGREGGGLPYFLMLGAMILLPFAVVGVTGYILVRGDESNL